MTLYDDPRLTEYLTEVARRLEASGLSIAVVEDPTLGAFGLPGGRVFVHSGLLSVVESEAQLAMIVARESAHDTSRLLAWTGKVPMSAVALGPTAAALLGLDLRLATAAAIEGYGPDGERAADADALRRLAAGGYDPREGARLFRVLATDDADRRELAEMFSYGNRRRMSERDEIARELLGDSRPTPGIGDQDAARAREFARRMRSLVRDNAALDLRAGRFALAQRQLDRVLAADPNDAAAQLAYGELYRLQSQRADGPARTEGAQRAIERYERALQLDPSYAEPFRQLALVHYQQRDTVRARAAFERYLAVRPDAPDARRIREYLAILGP